MLFLSAFHIFSHVTQRSEIERSIESGNTQVITGTISNYEAIRRDVGTARFKLGGIYFETGLNYGYQESKLPNSSLKNDYEAKITYQPISKVILKIELSEIDYIEHSERQLKVKNMCNNEGIC